MTRQATAGTQPDPGAQPDPGQPLDNLTFHNEGLRFHAVAAGPADGPLLILLHGFPEGWWGWHRQIAPLAQAGYRVVVPDQRGYNLSDKPPDVSAYRVDRLGGDVLALLDHLGRETTFLAGHDFGAAVAWWLLLTHPGRFQAAAILNVPHPLVMARQLRTSLGQLRRSWYIFAFQIPRLPEWWLARRHGHALVHSLVATSRAGTFRPADLDAYRRAWHQPGSLRAMLHWYRAALRAGFAAPGATTERVSVPLLILWGEEDHFLARAMASESLAYCDRGRAILLPNVSHWLQHEEPERVVRELIAHFRGVPA
ncbi:MAG: alpha/beta hydrolase [Cyanobacteriota bacterium]|nr:alpha/beta hydrolase [Cyanobacteriota bacterium]